MPWVGQSVERWRTGVDSEPANLWAAVEDEGTSASVLPLRNGLRFECRVLLDDVHREGGAVHGPVVRQETMVLEVGANEGVVNNDGNAERAQRRGRADARMHQDMRRHNRAG